MADETTNDELSEAEVPEWDEANDPDGYTRADLTPKDWTLDWLLHFTVGCYDDDRGSCGLTVLSGGVVVSGLATSEAEYHRLLIQQLHDAGATDTAHWIGKLNEQQVGLVHAKRSEREARTCPTAPAATFTCGTRVSAAASRRSMSICGAA